MITMSRKLWIRICLVVALVLIALFVIRLHGASGQIVAQGPGAQRPSAQEPSGNAESGRLYAQAWCTECHSVEPETAGTGKFAPDFTAIAKRRSTSARSLNAFLRSSHKLMPDFVLKRGEADDIVAYILSLKRG
jgi:mono/diheme cytochrome c family protein